MTFNSIARDVSSGKPVTKIKTKQNKKTKLCNGCQGWAQLAAVIVMSMWDKEKIVDSSAITAKTGVHSVFYCSVKRIHWYNVQMHWRQAINS